MRSLIEVACVVGLIGLAVCSVSANPNRQSAVNDQGCRSSYNVDHLKLAILWQPGYCATTRKQCATYKPTFSIHGLWPNLSNDEELGFCCVRDKYSSNQLNHLVGILKQDWPALETGPAGGRDFWNYQYKKHGSCADRISGLSGAYNYFNYALNLFQKLIDPQVALARKGITPSDTKVYSGQTIVNVLSGALGHKVALDCRGTQSEPTPVLKHVYVCVNTNLERIACPYTRKACLGGIKYPVTSRK